MDGEGRYIDVCIYTENKLLNFKQMEETTS
jgi:hypothetical protein